MTDVEYAWVAGLLEGEGCFTFGPEGGRVNSKKVRQLRITCAMTDRDTVEKLHRTVGMGNINPESRLDKRRSHNKPLWVWSATRRVDVIALLQAIRLHMSERRGQRIDELLKYAEDNPPIYGGPLLHGTPRCYRTGCRCAECKGYNNRKAKVYRDRKKAKVA